MGNSQISFTWTRSGLRLHINCLELKAVIFALHHWATVLQGYQVMIATDNTTVVSCSRTVPVASISGHISGCLNVIAEHLSQSARSTVNDRVESPSRDRNTNLQNVGYSEWTCLPQSTILCFPNSCQRFRSLKH